MSKYMTEFETGFSNFNAKIIKISNFYMNIYTFVFTWKFSRSLILIFGQF